LASTSHGVPIHVWPVRHRSFRPGRLLHGMLCSQPHVVCSYACAIVWHVVRGHPPLVPCLSSRHCRRSPGGLAFTCPPTRRWSMSPSSLTHVLAPSRGPGWFLRVPGACGVRCTCVAGRWFVVCAIIIVVRGKGAIRPRDQSSSHVVAGRLVWAGGASLLLGCDPKCNNAHSPCGALSLYHAVRPFAVCTYWLIFMSGCHPQVHSPSGLWFIVSCVPSGLQLSCGQRVPPVAQFQVS